MCSSPSLSLSVPLSPSSAAEPTAELAPDGGGTAAPQAAVIPSAGEESLIGDLLSLDLPTTSYNAPPAAGGQYCYSVHLYFRLSFSHIILVLLPLMCGITFVVDGLGDLLGDLSGLQVSME